MNARLLLRVIHSFVLIIVPTIKTEKSVFFFLIGDKLVHVLIDRLGLHGNPVSVLLFSAFPFDRTNIIVSVFENGERRVRLDVL